MEHQQPPSEFLRAEEGQCDGGLKVAPSRLALRLIPACQSLLKSKDTQQTSVSVVHSMNECLATLRIKCLDNYWIPLHPGTEIHLALTFASSAIVRSNIIFPKLWFIIKCLRTADILVS